MPNYLIFSLERTSLSVARLADDNMMQTDIVPGHRSHDTGAFLAWDMLPVIGLEILAPNSLDLNLDYKVCGHMQQKCVIRERMI